MALSEAHGVGGVNNIASATTSAVRCILEAQETNPAKAWRYALTSRDADLSATGWALMALKDAYYSGIIASEASASIRKATKYVLECRGCYQPGSNNGMAGHWGGVASVGLFALAVCEEFGNPQTKELLKFVSGLRADSMRNYYTIYYTNLALFQFGGKVWDDWNKQFREFIVNRQNKDGSFKVYDGGEKNYGLNYSTALATLSLEVYYRYLPINSIVKR
jgi:hypothetical protein